MKTTVLALIFLFQVTSWADIQADQLYRGDDLTAASLSSIVDSVEAGSVIVIGEFHGFTPHHEHQVELLEKLRTLFPQGPISVGLEHINYTKQNFVDQFLGGLIDEPTFLEKAQWPGVGFENYRRQVLFPRDNNGRTLALNAPRWLTYKISKNGIDSLTEEDRKFLPPNFVIGNDKYYQRFVKEMGNHVPEEKMINYFTSQSLWDDTMAWNALKELERNPETVLVVPIGEFHNAYGGGFPDRLLARGLSPKNLVTISQVDITELSTEEQIELMGPHPEWGQRADFIWTSKR